MIEWLLSAASSPTDSGTGSVVYGLALALIAVVGGSGFQFYKYRKQAGREDDSLIAAATGEAISAAKAMLSEYREELDRAKVALEDLRVKLEKANRDIARLEGELSSSHADRDRLYRQLEDAIERRAAMQQEMEMMRMRMSDLERVVGAAVAREDARTNAWTPDQEVRMRGEHGAVGPPGPPGPTGLTGERGEKGDHGQSGSHAA